MIGWLQKNLPTFFFGSGSNHNFKLSLNFLSSHVAPVFHPLLFFRVKGVNVSQPRSILAFIFRLPDALFKTYCVGARDEPMRFPRAHAVPFLCQSCLALANSPCRHKRPIESSKATPPPHPQQTALRGSVQMPDNRPTIMHKWQMQVVVVACLLERYSGPVSAHRSCCEDSSKKPLLIISVM